MKLLLIFAIISLATAPQAFAKTDFYVAGNGSDKNAGTKAKPFATLERARDAVRALKTAAGLPDGGVTVWVRGGVYPVSSTFKLTAGDSGTAVSPVVYRACEGEEVRLNGGREIKGFKRVSDPEILKRLDPSVRDKVLQTDLKAQGITDFGKLSARGFGRAGKPSHLELFFDDKPMTLAGWPNDGWAIIAGVPDGPKGGKFTYDGDRPSRWAAADDIWLHGYWTWPWADSYEKVKSIDTAKKEISTEPPHGVYGYQAHKRWRALNILEELDQPGEWYLERRTGILYFWPPEPLRGKRAFVSMIEDPMISLEDTSHVAVRGFTIEDCRGTAVKVSGGADNLVAGCVIRNVGDTAASISGGTANGIRGCDIYAIGDTAISLNGGDRATLTRGGNFADNNYIHHFSRWDRTYRPGVIVSGVGNQVSHNLICDAPHMAIGLSGNDHTIEFNEIHHVCLETGDAGAFYMGRDWTQRGNEVRFNYFHDLGGFEDKFSSHGFSETMAVYLDDWTSGTRIYGNVFYKANRAVMVGGGRDNAVENNVFVDCKLSVFVDARGLSDWTKSYWDGTDNTMFDRLKAVKYDQPPYSVHYPKLANILNDEPRVPKGNVIERNVSVGSKWLQLSGVKQEWLVMKDNLVDEDPLFVDAAKHNFQLKPDSPAFKLGFKRIPIDRIGLYRDEYRKQIYKK